MAILSKPVKVTDRYGNTNEVNRPRVGGVVAVSLASIFGLFVAIVAVWVIFASVGRWQARNDAQNQVHISAIEIQNQEQRVQIAKQQAEIRQQDAIGVREAQDEIAKTLTPLYVQYEMVQALQAIATSGRNNSIVYVPSGANGIPLVSTVNPNQVTTPDGSSK
jgi:hypothetical protein